MAKLTGRTTLACPQLLLDGELLRPFPARAP